MSDFRSKNSDFSINNAKTTLQIYQVPTDYRSVLFFFALPSTNLTHVSHITLFLMTFQQLNRFMHFIGIAITTTRVRRLQMTTRLTGLQSRYSLCYVCKWYVTLSHLIQKTNIVYIRVKYTHLKRKYQQYLLYILCPT